MKITNNILNRFKNMMPNHIKPKFTNAEDLLFWNQEQGRLRSESIIRQNQLMKMQRIMEFSGIKALHINCSFDNYIVENVGQQKALFMSRKYVNEFESSMASFIFSGTPGTGKNHLASAIANNLILRGKNVLIITIADLMSQIKSTFNNINSSNKTEELLLKDLTSIDLLIIDEIGIQSESRYEKIIINQIVDKRSASKKPTGMLSNLTHRSMNNILGEKVMDRMRLGKSIWVHFNWTSYRSRVIVNKY